MSVKKVNVRIHKKYIFQLYFAGIVSPAEPAIVKYAWKFKQISGMYGRQSKDSPGVPIIPPLSKKDRSCQLSGREVNPVKYTDPLIAHYLALRQGIGFVVNAGDELTESIGRLYLSTSCHQMGLSLHNYNRWLSGAASIMKRVDGMVDELREEIAMLLMRIQIPASHWEVKHCTVDPEIRWCQEQMKDRTEVKEEII